MKETLLWGFIVLSGLARAEGVYDQVRSGVCQKDFERYCANVPPGGGRILRCLAENASQLDDDCRRGGNFVEPMYAGIWGSMYKVPEAKPMPKCTRGDVLFKRKDCISQYE